MILPDINKVIDIAERAGQEILKLYRKDFNISFKADNTPVTLADKYAHDLITSELLSSYPDISLISEEGSVRSVRSRFFWLVDPLDGTAQFINKSDQFTVNIALIDIDKPVLGVVHIPVWNHTYYTDNKNSACFKDEYGNLHLLSVEKQDNKQKIIVSSKKKDHRVDDYIKQYYKESPVSFIYYESTIKYCMVASGKADIYPRFGLTYEWDTAAAHAILKACGKDIYVMDSKKSLTYNKQDFKNPDIVVY